MRRGNRNDKEVEGTFIYMKDKTKSKAYIRKQAIEAQLHLMFQHSSRAVGSLVVRASDSRLEGLVSMPDATKYPPSTHGVRAR
ncbi:hypothetical protein TNCV_1385651 [Trichonephila clavipes]|nr:hypothetical protein TNCV_1385651 [Trichonephila clavipes]